MLRPGKAIDAAGGSVLRADGGLALFAALTLLNLSNFGFHVVVSRLLGPEAYGVLAALLGVTLVLAVPVAALQVAITQAVAGREGERPGGRPPLDLGPLLAHAVLSAMAVFTGFALLAPFLRSFLHLSSLTGVVLLGAYTVPVLIGLIPKAVLIGQCRFKPVGLAIVAGAAVRLTLGVVFVRLGFGVDGALTATVLAEMATAGILLVPLRNEFHSPKRGEPLAVRSHDAVLAGTALSAFWLLTTIDVLLARHHLPAAAAGYYAAAATGARMVLFLPGAVALLALPRFAAAEGRGVEARQTLVQALVVTGSLGLVAAVVILILPGAFVSALFGAQYGASTVAVGILGLTAAGSGLVQVLLTFHLARRSPSALLPWVAVAAAWAGIALVHSSIAAIAMVMLIVVAGLLALSLVAALAGRDDPVDAGEAGTALWDLADPELDVTVVVPYFNPGHRLRGSLERLVGVLEGSGLAYEIVAVSDGSTDGSDGTILDLAPPEQVRCVSLKRNRGKGEALRVGLSLARGRYLGFIDGDGDLAPEGLTSFHALMRLYEPDIIIGSKRHPLSEVEYPVLRRIYSWGFQKLVRVLFGLEVRDTQTGLKLARREVLAVVLPRMIEKRYTFDLELLVVARRLGFRRLLEAPVRIGERFGSTISARAVWGMLADTLAIFYRLRILRYYDRVAEVAPTPVSELAPTPAHLSLAQTELGRSR